MNPGWRVGDVNAGALADLERELGVERVSTHVADVRDGASLVAALGVFTARTGGASRGAFSSLNFSSREGDVPERVIENWARLETAAELPAGG